MAFPGHATTIFVGTEDAIHDLSNLVPQLTITMAPNIDAKQMLGGGGVAEQLFTNYRLEMEIDEILRGTASEQFHEWLDSSPEVAPWMAVLIEQGTPLGSATNTATGPAANRFRISQRLFNSHEWTADFTEVIAVNVATMQKGQAYRGVNAVPFAFTSGASTGVATPQAAVADSAFIIVTAFAGTSATLDIAGVSTTIDSAGLYRATGLTAGAASLAPSAGTFTQCDGYVAVGKPIT